MQNEDNKQQAGNDAGEGASKKKKKVVKKVVKKAAASSGNGKTNSITLAEVCKGIKGLEPRAARRHLRNAKVKNPGRWTWDKGSAGHKAAVKVLNDATK